MEDWDLLRGYARNGYDEAFRELLQRHARLVYSAALRKLGDAHMAQDVTQRTFCLLAQRAASLPKTGSLVGWLYTTACRLANDCRRAERRRQLREDIAARMHPHSSDPSLSDSEDSWKILAPALDDAVASLADKDRLAVLLRYFDRRSMREIGAVFGVSEAAAKMRVGRALDRLRLLLVTRGINVSAGLLAGTLWNRTLTDLPIGLIESVGAQVPLQSVNAGATSTSFIKAFLMAEHSIRTTVMAGLVLLSLAAVSVYVANREREGSRPERNQTLTQMADQARPAANPRRFLQSHETGRDRLLSADQAAAIAQLRSAIADPWPTRNAPLERVREALEQFGRNRAAAVPVLLEYLEARGNVATQYLAAHGMIELGSDAAGALPDLLRLLGENRLATLNDALPRMFAAIATEATVVKDLIGAFSRTDLLARRQIGTAIIEVLERFPESEAVYRPMLVDLLANDDKETRRESALILTRWPWGSEPAAIPILLDALELDRLRDPLAYDTVYVPEQSTWISREDERWQDEVWRRRVVAALTRAGINARGAANAIAEMISRLPAGASELREEALLALAAIDPERSLTQAEVQKAAQEHQRGEYLSGRAHQGAASFDEILEGLKYRESVEECSKALAGFASDHRPETAVALNEAIDRFESFEAIQRLKETAPEALIARLKDRNLRGLSEVATALAALGPEAGGALTHLEAISEDLPLGDYGNIHAVTEAIQAIDPEHPKVLYNFADLHEATSALIEAIYLSGKTDGSVFNAYITGFQDQNAISRARLLQFVKATEADPDLNRIFVDKLIQKHPSLEKELGRK